jgi:hypothetical protein
MDRSHNLEEFKQMLANSSVLNVKRERPARTA